MKKIIGLVVVIVLLVALVGACDGLLNGAARAQAQATIEAARAAQIATFGQMLGTFFLGAVATLLLCGILAGCGLVMYQKMRRPKNEQGERLNVRRNERAQLPRVDPMQALAQVMTLRMMQDLRREQRYELPSGMIQNVGAVQEEEERLGEEWW
jgi:hypothetical protein